MSYDERDFQPRADERAEPIITSWRPRVRHLPLFVNSRNTSLRTACGKRGWFWRPSRFGGEEQPTDLPVCTGCERRVVQVGRRR